MRPKREATRLRRLPSPEAPRRGDSFEELLSDLYEAVEGCLSVDGREIPTSSGDRVVEIAM